MKAFLKSMPIVIAGLTAIGLLSTGSAQAKVVGDTILLGSAISFTGKYSTNGIHAKNGYDPRATASRV